MFKNKTYRTKFYYMLTAILVFSIISYKLAFKKTIEIRSEYKKINSEMANFTDVPFQIKELKKKLVKYDYSIEKSFSKQPVQVFILDYVAEYCKRNNVIIKDFPKAHIFRNQDYTVETNRLLLNGDFISLLKLVYNIEQQYRVGKISSVKFYKTFDNKTKTNELFSDIYIQTIKRNEQ